MDKYKSIAFLLFCPLLAVCAYMEDTENLDDAKKKVDFAEESINKLSKNSPCFSLGMNCGR